jgi:hypothetical protein
MSTVLADQHGVPMSGSAEAVALYDHAIDRLLRFHPDVVSDAETLTPTCRWATPSWHTST